MFATYILESVSPLPAPPTCKLPVLGILTKPADETLSLSVPPVSTQTVSAPENLIAVSTSPV